MSHHPRDFSKNSITLAAHRSGIRCISSSGIEKIRHLLDAKVLELSEKLAMFYTGKNGKTITKQLVLDFLQSEGISFASSSEE